MTFEKRMQFLLEDIQTLLLQGDRGMEYLKSKLAL